MRTLKVIVILFSILASNPLWAQMQDKPKSPTFDYMTIDPSTGYPTLYWTAPSYDPQYPNPQGYIIYRYLVDNLGNKDFHEIDTVSQSTFTYTDINANGNIDTLRYTIASLGLTEPSKQTREHAQIWLTSAYDSCNAKIDLSWKRYEGWDNNNTDQYYNLYMGTTPDWTTFNHVADVDKFDLTYSIKNVSENQDYYFYITASRVDTSFVTYSNLYHIYTKMAAHPQYMQIDSIIGTDDGNKIYYTIDPTTEITDFKLIRWEQPDTNQSIFSARVISSFSNPNNTYTLDSTDTWAQRTRKFYYKVDAYNGCNRAVNLTNLCNSIIPRIKPKGSTVHLEWDTLMIDTKRKPLRVGDFVKYDVYRIAFQGDQSNFSVAAQEISTPYFDDDLSSFKGSNPLYQLLFKYYIIAIERNTSNKIVAVSQSRVVQTEILPGVTMPTAFVPNDPTSNYDHPRNIFKPIINFEASFLLTIYDRWGGVIYHGNEGWDGKKSNGEFVKEGVYVYRLEIPTENAGSVIKNGSVSVIYR